MSYELKGKYSYLKITYPLHSLLSIAMNLLIVIHNWIGYNPYGGTEIHASAIVQALSQNKSIQVYVLFPNVKITNQCNYLLLNINNKSVKHITVTHPVEIDCYSHPEFTSIFESLLRQHQIDIVHFLHLLRFPLNLPLIAKKIGTITIVSFFDYYLVCRQFNFLNKDNNFCGYPDITTPTCDLCLKQCFNAQVGTQITRRNLISQILYYSDAVHYLCQDQYQKINLTYPHLQYKTSLVMGLGIGAKFTAQYITNKLNYFRLPLKVACVGNFDINKGAELIIQVIDYYQSTHQSIEFHIYGDIRHPFSNTLLEMANKNCKSIKTYGQYNSEDLPNLLQDCHVALFASIWPETFVIALSEVWSCGLIPIAPNIGAFSERITDGKNGFLYNYKDYGSIITILDSFLNMAQEDFLNFLARVSQVKYPSLENNLNQYLTLYNNLLETASNISNMELISRIWNIENVERLDLSASYVSKTTNILYKTWQYYKQHGLTSTVKRITNYTLQKTISQFKKIYESI
jgi:glycosyltransferase involved in cell wall biosynthesis